MYCIKRYKYIQFKGFNTEEVKSFFSNYIGTKYEIELQTYDNDNHCLYIDGQKVMVGDFILLNNKNNIWEVCSWKDFDEQFEFESSPSNDITYDPPVVPVSPFQPYIQQPPIL